jgi:PAT family beta-lactamase induction signal transducer AmpG
MKEFFSRQQAWIIVAFILLYKVGDNMAAHMSMPFYLDIGFSRTEVGSITKIVGWIGIAGGSLVGGWLLKKISVISGLCWFGVLQMVSTFGFAVLSIAPKTIELLTAVILFENLSAGLGTSAFVTFIGLMTNKQFTATQFALLSSLMGIPRILFSAPTGFIAQSTGWFWFFTICTLIAVPGVIMIPKLKTHLS